MLWLCWSISRFISLSSTNVNALILICIDPGAKRSWYFGTFIEELTFSPTKASRLSVFNSIIKESRLECISVTHIGSSVSCGRFLFSSPMFVDV